MFGPTVPQKYMKIEIERMEYPGKWDDSDHSTALD